MNLRKFCFTVSSVIVLFLFCSGMYLLNEINASKTAGAMSNSPFAPWIDDFVDNKPMNILLLGGDKVNKNTDTMMIINYNPSKSVISVLSIPRDTKVQIKGRTRKINFAYPNGDIDLTKQTIKDLLGIDINYYIYIDTSVFRKIIDQLDGVSYNVPANMKYDDDVQNIHIDLKKGQQILNGKEAEQFMRFRHPNVTKKGAEINKYYNGSDLNRIDAQQSFIKEVFKQKANILYLPKLKDVLDTLFTDVKTNFSLNDAVRLVQKVTELNSGGITYYKLSGEDKYIGDASYYVYNNKITNNATKESVDANSILSEYFSSDAGFVENINSIEEDTSKSNADEGKSTKPKTKDIKKNNPSNSETGLKGTKKPEP